MALRRGVVATVCTGLLLLGAATAHAAAPQTPGAAKLHQKEEQARGKAAAELASLARFAATKNAFDAARSAFSLAFVLAPRDEKLVAEVAQFKKRKQKAQGPKEADLAQVAERRTKALAKAAELLAPVVAAYADADRSDELARLVALLRAHELPVEDLIAKHELVFFEPYFDWRTKKDVERLSAGWEIVDGAWRDSKDVAKLDAEHAAWSLPWRVADEVHEVRTTMPLRTARRILASVASFRNFLLGYFAGELDLRPPDVKLPIILTATRAELEERADEHQGGGRVPPNAAAFYLSGNGVGNPCFVSFEMRTASGDVIKGDMAGLRTALLHEAAHQILFEYSKHAADRRRPTEHYPWVVEGIAEFLPSYVLVDGVWVLKRLRAIPTAKGQFAEGGFGWCRDHADRLTPLREFVTASGDAMSTVEKYHLACGLVAFLLEAKDQAYRSAFCALAGPVHQARETPDLFAACFKGVDLDQLDAEFRAFCRGIKLDDK